MPEYLKQLVDELVFLNDDNLAQRVIDNNDVQWCLSELQDILSADVVPVVRCKDCTHCYETLGGWCCAYGTCVDCIVQPDFYCAFGKRKDGDTP